MTITEKALVRAAKAYEAVPSYEMQLLLHFAAYMVFSDPTIKRVSDSTWRAGKGSDE